MRKNFLINGSSDLRKGVLWAFWATPKMLWDPHCSSSYPGTPSVAQAWEGP